MKKNILLLICLIIIKTADAQLTANFHCTGSGSDAGCGGFGDASIPGNGVITSWFWDFGNGTTSSMQNPDNICYDSLGSYNVCLTVFDSNGDSSKICKQNYIVVDATGQHCNVSTGFNDVSTSEFEFGFYPNPIINQFSLKTNNNEPSEIILYDIESRKLLQQKFTNFVSINTEQLAKGIYIFEFRDRNGLCKKGKVLKD